MKQSPAGFAARDVCVVGLGYIGLPTAAIIASRGHRVRGVDINHDVVKTIRRGQIHIVEPELDILVKMAVESGRLAASKEPACADVFILCVPTPFYPQTRAPNLEYVESATRLIAPFVRPGNIVVLESTSPPGTTENVVGDVLRQAGLKPGDNVRLAHCPERVLPGAILREVVSNNRIIGGLTPRCARETMTFYHTFVQGEIHLTDCKTAETVKLVENASRDAQIAFANELSLLADEIGVNVWEVIRLANRHPRVSILQPGPGVGGHCIAVDPWFLVHAAPDTARFIRAARERNDAMPAHTARRIIHCAHERGAKCVALLGMSYKNDIDDCRESPSIAVYEGVRREAPELECLACEPNVQALNGVQLASFEECLARAGVFAVLVAHHEFRDYDWASLPTDKMVLDFKGIFDACQAPAAAGK